MKSGAGPSAGMMLNGKLDMIIFYIVWLINFNISNVFSLNWLDDTIQNGQLDPIKYNVQYIFSQIFTIDTP